MSEVEVLQAFGGDCPTTLFCFRFRFSELLALPKLPFPTVARFGCTDLCINLSFVQLS